LFHARVDEIWAALWSGRRALVVPRARG